ncbi:MAG: DUF3408 domain-containing protein [Prevotellaceae bacterium]|jgi:hypothetical protein|nr:DUF3408 domain-containing protein [Prevotellaceae bacterium]
MAKKMTDINEEEMLARMAGNGYHSTTNNSQQFEQPIPENIAPEKEEKFFMNELSPAVEARSGNGKKDSYVEKYLSRNIIGTVRGNVGISKGTLDIAEKVIARIFDNKIAVGAYIDNIVLEHFNKHKKDYELWLTEKPTAIF